MSEALALCWHRPSAAQGWPKARPDACRARGRADSEPRSIAAPAIGQGQAPSAKQAGASLKNGKLIYGSFDGVAASG
ncbi:hypothetical protein FRY97_10775 [Phaeodactylibacter luteus]|uniref:Uncharacterized protein n=1 Tax=Phaeodactylibacter luteus TaxID=1564516 RepID=A0A5C6RLK2_9BACT|nr:hypothetical protein FRY97_10775 [Phaeodactylibacter luteus]